MRCGVHRIPPPLNHFGERRGGGLCSAIIPYLSLFLLLLIFPFLAGFYPIVRFTEEQIDIHVYPDYIIVEGYYIYKNPFPFPVAQGFSIPFHIDKSHPMPVQISVKRLSPAQGHVPIIYLLGRHRFDLRFSTGEEVRIQVSYRQQAQKRDAMYILTTTKPWRRPLVYGIYKLYTEGVNITSSNYLLQSDEPGVFSFYSKDFMPREDWHFSWEVK